VGFHGRVEPVVGWFFSKVFCISWVNFMTSSILAFAISVVIFFIDINSASLTEHTIQFIAHSPVQGTAGTVDAIS
jgi:hypothetical protein